jgi:SAM-dependent methyltransferase
MLACGTGRTGAWLRERGVGIIDGVDITPEMLAGAASRSIYRRLVEADVGCTGLDNAAYDLAIQALAEEHLPDLAPLYNEAARIARSGGHFILVGYHPHFLMAGLVTHFHRTDGEPGAIRSTVHLMSDPVSFAMNWRKP